MPRSPATPRCVSGPIWRATSCTLPTKLSTGGKQQLGSIEVDLKAFSPMPRSFLRLAIDNQKYPIHHSIANKFDRALRAVASDEAAVAILNSRPEQLTYVEIVKLYSTIETYIESWGDKSRRTMSQHALKLLREMPERLSDGSTASRSGFATRFKNPRPVPKSSAADRPLRKNAAPTSYAATDDAALPLLDALRFDSLSERNAKAFESASSRKEEIARLCLKTFRQHDALVERICSAKQAGLPDLGLRPYWLKRGGVINRESLARLSEADQLRVILHIMEREKFHLVCPNLDFMPLDGLKFLEDELPANSKKTYAMRRELLMSDYYLPAQVVAACLVAIQNDTILNVDVISKLTKGDILKTKRGYRFIGVKGRTDQIQARDVQVPSDDEPQWYHCTSLASVRAFELLLGHVDSIEAHHRTRYIPLMTCINTQFERGPLKFAVKSAWLLTRLFCDLHDLHRFDTRYLRALGLQTHVLSPMGDIYSTQALAGHGSVNTTEIYVYTNVVRFLHLANIRRFMDMLAASILWKTDRKELLVQSGLGQRGFNLQLLFPQEGDDQSEKSAVEEWIGSGFTSEVAVGLDELEQCAAQYSYYQLALAQLPQRNAHRFLVVHVPRILTCYAMRNIILASQFASVYRKFEARYQ